MLPPPRFVILLEGWKKTKRCGDNEKWNSPIECRWQSKMRKTERVLYFSSLISPPTQSLAATKEFVKFLIASFWVENPSLRISYLFGGEGGINKSRIRRREVLENFLQKYWRLKCEKFSKNEGTSFSFGKEFYVGNFIFAQTEMEGKGMRMVQK